MLLPLIGPHGVRNILRISCLDVSVLSLLGHPVRDETAWPITLYSFTHSHVMECPNGFALLNTGHQCFVDSPYWLYPLKNPDAFFFFFFFFKIGAGRRSVAVFPNLVLDLAVR